MCRLEMNSRSKIHDLEAEVERLKSKVNQLRLRNAEVENKMESIGLRLHDLDIENTVLKVRLAENNGKDLLPKIFHGHCKFNRHNVALPLSQMIAAKTTPEQAVTHRVGENL